MRYRQMGKLLGFKKPRAVKNNVIPERVAEVVVPVIEPVPEPVVEPIPEPVVLQVCPHCGSTLNLNALTN